MSRLLLHDSGRQGKLGWAAGAVADGLAGGFVVSPFQTPMEAVPRRPGRAARPGATEALAAMVEVGGSVFFDPTTVGVLAPGANDFDMYDTWDLWSGPRGRRTDASLASHVDRCLDRAHRFRLDPIAPTITLDAPHGREADLAYDMADRALRTNADCTISLTGTPGFWTAGAVLDAYVGALISLRPPRVYVVTARQSITLPAPGASAEELAGLCRSTHSLAMHCEVVAGYGDLGALPSIAAGAGLLGTGWDLRHRVCGHDAFRRASQGGRAAQRVTHRGLLAWLKRPEAEALLQADSARSVTLVPGPLPPNWNGHWRHHLWCLNQLVDRIVRENGAETRTRLLQRLYQRARSQFAQVEGLIGRLNNGAGPWLLAVSDGLDLYADGEGW